MRAGETVTPHGIGILRIGLGDRLDVGGTTTDGRVEVVIRGRDVYTLAGELAAVVEWLEVTDPPSVRHHLASIGGALVERYGGAARDSLQPSPGPSDQPHWVTAQLALPCPPAAPSTHARACASCRCYRWSGHLPAGLRNIGVRMTRAHTMNRITRHMVHQRMRS